MATTHSSAFFLVMLYDVIVVLEIEFLLSLDRLFLERTTGMDGGGSRTKAVEVEIYQC